MVEYTGARISVLLAQLRELGQRLKPIKVVNLSGPAAEASIEGLLNGIEDECKKLQLPTSFVGVLKERLNTGSPPAAVAMSFGLLHQTIEKELENTLFLFLPTQDAALYRGPTSQFVKTREAFPEAISDMIGASRCYVLGQGTACVFHCMGILQYGLYALAHELFIEEEFSSSIKLENWQNIIEKIEQAIKRIQQTKKSDTKDEQFYSGLAVQFRYFKDAWRNHICHQRQQYDIHGAQSILTHVADFMELLSSRLKEIPI